MRIALRSALVVGVLALASMAAAHCQIPCGIYTDEMRFQMIEEDLLTIEKSMDQVQALSGGENFNQLVRWVNNKETHAQHIQDVIAAYFLTQRIKPVEDAGGREDYLKSLELLHRMQVEAMKCKQTTDKDHVANLRSHLAAFHDHYFKDKEHDHK